MKLKEVKKIADRISKKYNMVDREGKPLVIAERLTLEDGLKVIEVRTELPSYEGGNELVDEVIKKFGYEGENLGGCVYRFFKGDDIK